MNPGVNIRGKASAVSINRAGDSGGRGGGDALRLSAGILGGRENFGHPLPPKTFSL